MVLKSCLFLLARTTKRIHCLNHSLVLFVLLILSGTSVLVPLLGLLPLVILLHPPCLNLGVFHQHCCQYQSVLALIAFGASITLADRRMLELIEGDTPYPGNQKFAIVGVL